MTEAKFLCQCGTRFKLGVDPATGRATTAPTCPGCQADATPAVRAWLEFLRPPPVRPLKEVHVNCPCGMRFKFDLELHEEAVAANVVCTACQTDLNAAARAAIAAVRDDGRRRGDESPSTPAESERLLTSSPTQATNPLTPALSPSVGEGEKKAAAASPLAPAAETVLAKTSAGDLQSPSSAPSTTDGGFKPAALVATDGGFKPPAPVPANPLTPALSPVGGEVEKKGVASSSAESVLAKTSAGDLQSPSSASSTTDGGFKPPAPVAESAVAKSVLPPGALPPLVAPARTSSPAAPAAAVSPAAKPETPNSKSQTPSAAPAAKSSGPPGARSASAPRKPAASAPVRRDPGEPSVVRALAGLVGGALIGAAVWLVAAKATGNGLGFLALLVGGLAGVGARVLGRGAGAQLAVLTGVVTAVVAVGSGWLASGAGLKSYTQRIATGSYDAQMRMAQDAAKATTDAELQMMLMRGSAMSMGGGPMMGGAPKSLDEWKTKELPRLRDLAAGKPSRKDFEAQAAAKALTGISLADRLETGLGIIGCLMIVLSPLLACGIVAKQ